MPAGTPGFDSLSVVRVQAVMKALSDDRDLPRKARLPRPDADRPGRGRRDHGSWINRDQIADLIPDDAKARTYTSASSTWKPPRFPISSWAARSPRARSTPCDGRAWGWRWPKTRTWSSRRCSTSRP